MTSQGADTSQQATSGNRRYTRQQMSQEKCFFCGYKRDSKEKCPADGKQCMKCNKIGHFSKVCTSKMINELNSNVTDENNLSSESIHKMNYTFDSIEIQVIQVTRGLSSVEKTDSGRSWIVNSTLLDINKIVKFKID